MVSVDCEMDYDKGGTENEILATTTEDFIPEYISALFDESRGLTYEESSKFGELARDAKSRLQFAMLIDARRVDSKCVAEITFYKLLHSFALVLFECAEADNFIPGKILMNMAFTYYHIPNVSQVAFEQTFHFFRGKDALKQPPVKDGSDDKKGKKKDFKMQAKLNLQKAISACRDALKDFDIVIDTEEELKSKKKRKNFSVEVHRKEKYLYEYLKNQPIWKSDRFWEEALFMAVSSERQRRCTMRPWSKLSDEERHGFDDAFGNITFGQLVTFSNNMKCLGVSEDVRRQFITKHAAVGGIGKNTDLYNMLLTQLDD